MIIQKTNLVNHVARLLKLGDGSHCPLNVKNSALALFNRLLTHRYDVNIDFKMI